MTTCAQEFFVERESEACDPEIQQLASSTLTRGAILFCPASDHVGGVQVGGWSVWTEHVPNRRLVSEHLTPSGGRRSTSFAASLPAPSLAATSLEFCKESRTVGPSRYQAPRERAPGCTRPRSGRDPAVLKVAR